MHEGAGELAEESIVQVLGFQLFFSEFCVDRQMFGNRTI